MRNGAKSLLAKVDAAAQAQSRGNCFAASAIYGALVNEVRAQSGKTISDTAAATLTGDAQYLMQHCPSV